MGNRQSNNQIAQSCECDCIGPNVSGDRSHKFCEPGCTMPRSCWSSGADAKPESSSSSIEPTIAFQDNFGATKDTMKLKLNSCQATPELLKTEIPHASFDKSKYHLEYYYDLDQNCTGKAYTKTQPGPLVCDSSTPTTCPGAYKLVSN